MSALPASRRRPSPAALAAVLALALVPALPGRARAQGAPRVSASATLLATARVVDPVARPVVERLEVSASRTGGAASRGLVTSRVSLAGERPLVAEVRLAGAAGVRVVVLDAAGVEHELTDGASIPVAMTVAGGRYDSVLRYRVAGGSGDAAAPSAGVELVLRVEERSPVL